MMFLMESERLREKCILAHFLIDIHAVTHLLWSWSLWRFNCLTVLRYFYSPNELLIFMVFD